MGIIVVFGSVDNPVRVTSKDYSGLRRIAGLRFKQKIRVVRIGDDTKMSEIYTHLNDLEIRGEEIDQQTVPQLQENFLRAAFGQGSLEEVLAYVLLPSDPTIMDNYEDWKWVIEQMPKEACGYRAEPSANGKGRWLDWIGDGRRIL
jgi:hypothetical protein